MLNRRSALALVAIVLGACLALTGYVYQVDRQQQRTMQRDAVIQQAGAIRAAVEQEVNTALNLTLGLVVYVAANPDLGEDAFADLAVRIHQRAPYLRNIALARDNVISHIYPVEGNRQALGLRYIDNPEQWAAVSRAIASGNTVIAGPVNLVQGGEGLISRIPIYLDDSRNRYWGIASLVIDVEDFFDRIGLEGYQAQVAIALRGKDSTGLDGPVFYGDPALFASDRAVISAVSLPTGSWGLAVHPLPDASVTGLRPQLVLLLGVGISVLVALLLFALLDTLVALAKAKRRAEHANEVKTRFFSHMTHELRTPLTAIQGAIGLLTSEAVRSNPLQVGELVDNARRNCERLSWVINDVLDLKRLEAGGITYAFEPCGVRELVETAVDGVHHYAEQYHTHIEIEDALGGDVQVMADAHRLQQVLINLLSNAIKYSPEDSTVTVNASRLDGWVRIEVIDQGEGVNEDRIDDIFNEFSQDKVSPRRNIAATGLGLSISKLIVEQHEGRIGVYNIAGGGCSFFVELPRLRA